MKIKILIISLAVIVAFVVAGLFISQRPTPPEAHVKKESVAHAAVALTPPPPAPIPIAEPPTPPVIAAPAQDLPQVASSDSTARPLPIKAASLAIIKSPP